MAIRFRQLQAFHAIYESGTVTGAANVLGISQPGVSNLISQLERETRFRLFERVRGRLIPTPEASVLYREVDTVVRGLDHVGQAITDLQNKQGGQLQVASQHALSFGFMPRLIAQFARDRPDMSISFQSQYSSKVQEWVVAGLFEIGVSEAPQLYDELQVYPFSLEMVVALHPENPLRQHAVLTPELLAGAPFIAMGPDHMSHRRMREAFDAAGVPWKVRVHSHLFRNVLSFVQEGMGVALFDPLFLQHEKAGGFVTRPFRPRVMMDNIVVTSRDRPISALGRSFLELLLEEIEKSCPKGILPDAAE